MKKTNSNIKRKNFIKRFIANSILVQAVILILFLACFYGSKPIELDNCTQKQIVITDKTYELPIYGEHKCYVFSNEDRYEIPSEEHSPKEVYEMIDVGKVLCIKYTERIGFFKKYNLIVDAKYEDGTTILSFDSYNLQKEKGFIFGIVLFSAIEFVYLVCAFLIIMLNRKLLFNKARRFGHLFGGNT